MHEFMHALGFWHEQSRPDRDVFVRILWENIIPSKMAVTLFYNEVDLCLRYIIRKLNHIFFIKLQVVAGRVLLKRISPSDRHFVGVGSLVFSKFGTGLETHMKLCAIVPDLLKNVVISGFSEFSP